MPKERSFGKWISIGGFTLLEVMIILGIMAVLSAIAYPNLQRYAINGNLRSAARDVVAEFAAQKQRAMTGDQDAHGNTRPTREHRISLNFSGKTYRLERCVSEQVPCNGWEDLQVKSLISFGSDIAYDPARTTESTFEFHTRGTVTQGTLVLTNSRGSTATIESNISGRTFVEFDMR